MIPRSRHGDESEPREEDLDASARVVRRVFGHEAGSGGQLAGDAAALEKTTLELERRERALQDERASIDRLLRRSTAELEAREQELVQFERELDARDERLRAAEEEVAQRRSDLGAVELKRAALDQRERALEAREVEAAEREARAAGTYDPGPQTAELFFVPGPGYRLVRAHPTPVPIGGLAQVQGERYRVARVGPSPLPGDSRRCAYLLSPAPTGDAETA